MLTETVNGALSQTNLYNKANQITVTQNKNSSYLQSQFAYTYSENGNMTAAQEMLDATSSRAFTYDGMGRLTGEILGTDTLNYTYDDFSNRISMSKESGTTNYVYDGNNRLTNRTAGNTESLFNYDNNGNLYSTLTSTIGTAGVENETLSEIASDTDGLYTFDGLGRLTGLEKDGKTISYTYNGDGQRVSKTVDGVTTTYVWDGDYIVMEKTGDSTTVYKRANRLFASEKDGKKTFYRYNVRGDIVQLTDATYSVTKSYQYDAFGNEQNIDATDTNSFRYCGEYYDTETGYIYLRARYYDPTIGRFISEDIYWNSQNRISESDTSAPNVYCILQSNNLYVYVSNNPLRYIDPSGFRSKEVADKIIKDNASYIIYAAGEFGVNPGILAATIYAEQRLNVDWKDDYIDGIVGFYGIDTSIGIGQLRISTAKLMEEKGYMPKISSENGGWNIPIIGFVHGTEQMARVKALENPKTNIRYAAAYLRYFQDRWKEVYSEIDGRTAILATLYNQGEQYPPHSNPVPNPFGEFAKENYYHVRMLLGLE